MNNWIILSMQFWLIKIKMDQYESKYMVIFANINFINNNFLIIIE